MAPTREELEKYFRNNRKYFDELAKNYKITDPDYYNKNIAPFYGGSYQTGSGNRQNSKLISLMALSILIAAGVFALVFFVKQNSDDKPVINSEEIEKLSNEVKTKLDTVNQKILDTEKLLDTMNKTKSNYDYNHGKFLFKVRKFEEAETYLMKVPKDHPEYQQVEYMLHEIKKHKGPFNNP